MIDKKMNKLHMVEWNVDGWRDNWRVERKKSGRIWNEVNGSDVVVMVETHLKREEREEFERKMGGHKAWVFVHAYQEKEGMFSGVTIMIKRKSLQKGEEDVEGEGDEKEGRWAIATVSNWLEEDVVICGLYAACDPKEREEWMEEMERKMEQKKGYRVMVGDLNFVMDTKWDKIGGNKNRGMRGKKQQESWESNLGVRDVWRRRNPERVGTTWTARGERGSKLVKTRIDRWLIDGRLEDEGRIGAIEMERTRVSDHDMVTCQLAVKGRSGGSCYDRMPRGMMDDEEFGEEVKRIYEEVRGGEGSVLEKHEVLKERCLEEALKRKKKWKKKKKKDRKKMRNEVKRMRRIVNWIEDARIQVERSRSIKRWERGNEMIRKSGVEKWAGKKMQEMGLEELQKAAEKKLSELLKQREDMDERARRLQKNLEKMEKVELDEKGTRYFYQKVKMYSKQGEIDALMEEEDSEIEEEIKNDETDDIDEMKEIARKFYERL